MARPKRDPGRGPGFKDRPQRALGARLATYILRDLVRVSLADRVFASTGGDTPACAPGGEVKILGGRL